MSLHQLADHVQSAGRGDDKVLVHMTPKEVSGLQSLAMAHGGSLTINPQTGLPEAGFLSSILPMVAGLALGPAGLGLSALQAGAVTGLAGAAMTGSLGKGLMMGLGAYGGAGLGAGLSNMGATQAAQQAYAPQAAQWAEVSKNIQNFNPAAAATTTTATGAPAQVFTATTPTGLSGGLPPDILRGGAGFGGAGAPPTIASTVPAAPAAPIADFSKITPELGGMKAFPTQPTTQIADFSRATMPEPINPYASLPTAPSTMDKLGMGVKQATSGVQGLKDLYAASEAAAPYSGMASLGSTAMNYYYDKQGEDKGVPTSTSLIRPYEFSREVNQSAFDMGEPIYSARPGSSAERRYFTDKYTALTPYKAPGPEYAAEGGLMGMAVGGPVEQMAAINSVGANTGYPMAAINTPLYANPAMQRPEAFNVISPSAEPAVGMYSGEPKFAGGGISHLGDYSDGGRLLKGPGDGVSDSIPAVIGERQPARLADGEFVVPARIVSELGNGSTEAGARKLYAMMDRVQKARRKTVGKGKVAANTRSEKYLPA